MIIGFCGRISSGKSEAISYLKEKNFHYFSLSDELRKEAKKRSIEINRRNLQLLGNELRKKHGEGILAKMANEYMKSNLSLDYVIDSIRNPSEVYELKRNKNFYLIAMDAPLELRYKRSLKRRKDKDPIKFEEFIKIDNIDYGINEKSYGQQTKECMKLSDFYIFNNFDLNSLKEKINEILVSIKQKNN